MISKKIIFFPVLGCIPENSLKNILQCLEQHKVKKKKKKNQKPTANCKPTTAIHRKSTANYHKKTHKPTIRAKLTQSKPRTNQNKQIKTHKSSHRQARERSAKPSDQIRLRPP
jgi:hypothetical protein